MCLELEYRGTLQAQDRLESDASAEDYEVPQRQGVEVLLLVFEHVFCWVFSVELALRVATYRRKFFVGFFNLLDVFIVVASIFELYLIQMLPVVSMPKVTYVRLIRLFRLARLLRAFRTFVLFRPLRLLVATIVSSVGSLVWSFFLLSVIQFIASIFLTQMLHPWIMDPDNDLADRKLVYELFGRFSYSCLTVFELTMVGSKWGNVGRILMHRVHWMYIFVFVLYGWLVVFCVIRVIGALFLKHAMAAVAMDPEQAMDERARKRAREMRTLQNIFEHVDSDGSASMSFEEFETTMHLPQVKQMMSMLEIDVSDAEALFHLLDDGDGHIMMHEFVRGVMRIRGAAKSMDVVSLMYQGSRFQMHLERVEALVASLPGIRDLPADHAKGWDVPHLPEGL